MSQLMAPFSQILLFLTNFQLSVDPTPNDSMISRSWEVHCPFSLKFCICNEESYQGTIMQLFCIWQAMEISMAYPMEISRTWKFPWVKPAATHGNFQGLEISMTWKIPGPDTHLPLQNFFDGEYFAMNLFLQRHLLLFI